jgi:MFS family permease
MAGRALTSYAWGVFADRYGRRPVILIALANIVVMTLVFGFVGSLGLAIAVRAVTGMFNG